MDEPESSLSLLNVFDVLEGDVHHHLICFLDPVLAGARGINSRAIIGEYKPGPDQEFDVESFVLNTEFLEALVEYMNETMAVSPELVFEASRQAGEMLFIIDPRSHDLGDREPSTTEVLGRFMVDGEGKIVAGSFEYNEGHRWFVEDAGASGVLSDRAFYDWLHKLEPPHA